MHVIVWRYTVDPWHRRDFEQAYGPSGPWVELFARAPGYLGTELVRLDEPGHYLTIDRWQRHSDHERFMREWADEYAELDRALEAVTAREERIAAGEVVGPPAL